MKEKKESPRYGGNLISYIFGFYFYKYIYWSLRGWGIWYRFVKVSLSFDRETIVLFIVCEEEVSKGGRESCPTI